MRHALPENRSPEQHAVRSERGGDGGEDVRRLLRERAGEAVEEVVQRDGVVLATHVLGKRLEYVMLERFDRAFVSRARNTALRVREGVRIEVAQRDELCLGELA